MRLKLSALLTAISVCAVAQHPSLTIPRHSWDWNENGCIYRWSVTCSNSSGKTYTGVKFRLTLRDKTDFEVIYSKIHTVPLNIGPEETTPSPKFRLSGELCGIDDLDGLDGYLFDAEILSAW